MGFKVIHTRGHGHDWTLLMICRMVSSHLLAQGTGAVARPMAEPIRLVTKSPRNRTRLPAGRMGRGQFNAGTSTRSNWALADVDRLAHQPLRTLCDAQHRSIGRLAVARFPELQWQSLPT